MLYIFPNSRSRSTSVRRFTICLPWGQISERNAVVTFQELDAAGREKTALRKLDLGERYTEFEKALLA